MLQSRTLQVDPQSLINPEGITIKQRILTPENFERTSLDEQSFGNYLRNSPLKSHGTDVRLYNGALKRNKVHIAVINMDVGNKDLQQCADAIIRLRAEYLCWRKLYGLIQQQKKSKLRNGNFPLMN